MMSEETENVIPEGFQEIVDGMAEGIGHLLNNLPNGEDYGFVVMLVDSRAKNAALASDMNDDNVRHVLAGALMNATMNNESKPVDEKSKIIIRH